eukprot:TRINITY_DN6068_c0_g2_i6.p1 TRINITY_DN6068_c0_g2~~TRINITY_DN6068_c0_g2_i6.p1  ORF type:complete len:182 (-),score=47.78 TRINITY_DN6068_c0_g2_i6:66-611(-)
MAPIDGVATLQGDITKQSTVDRILATFQGQKAQLVVSDGAPDVTGFHDMDQYVQSQLLVAAANIATHTLAPDGIFVAKIFKGHDVAFLYSQFKVFFRMVLILKPVSSRASSVENFIVCRGYEPPSFFTPFLLTTFDQQPTDQPLYAMAPQKSAGKEEEAKEYEKLHKFVTCGDLSAFDEDN